LRVGIAEHVIVALALGVEAPTATPVRWIESGPEKRAAVPK
jgi:hypothetical protein